MKIAELTRQAREFAEGLGFLLVGITSPEPPAHMDVFRNWVSAGHHGKMDYLATQDAIRRRTDPRLVLPECKSILVLGIPYDNPKNLKSNADQGRIAAYAWNKDYHEILKPRLKALVEQLEKLVGHAIPNRWFTDTGPILERELAQRAGLGWIGKNTLLINPQRGSYFLLAEILLGIELDFDAPIATDHCGSCRRCLEACPTSCIREDRTLDATRCISYLTIELKGSIPRALRPMLGDWIFGCDICQIVCPWNERYAEQKGDPAFSGTHAARLAQEIKLDTRGFNSKFKASPILRAKRRGYLRNATIAIGNNGHSDSVPILAMVLKSDKEPMVREHAAWALGQIGGEIARAELRNAELNETNLKVIEEIQAALNAG